ncbi:Hint domain-containing protein [Mameliella alba]|nr:Hint domain-containing protein [Antarctobacter heliothermus]MBY6146583.1 Hint domain-containing protein [Mameliella alba]MCA0956275.1 Hint domain-containing protein [Mameliella alba]
MPDKLPVDTSATAMQMADAMFGSGIQIQSASYTGADVASGIYTDGDAIAPDLTPTDSGVILSTGKATDVTSGGSDVNTSAGTTTVNQTAGDSDLTAVSGQATYDAAVLEAEFIPEGSTLTMQIVFSSEEYLEYVNSGFNDAVGIWVNGEPAELTVGTGDVTINNINDQSNSNLYVDNAQNADTYNTQMDGFTVTLTLKAPVNPGEVNTIKIGIADGGDSAYDSNLLIAGDSIQTALVAGDDEIDVQLGQDVEIDLLANDTSATGGALTITHINGQPVEIGDSVQLSTGEVVELTADGLIMASSGADIGANIFSYTVADAEGNTDVGFVTVNTTAPCFTAGTLIETPDGPVRVEDLSPGDKVLTLDHGAQRVKWIGRSERRAAGPDAPVEIAAGAFGATRATRVSPQHRLLVRDLRATLLFGGEEVLVCARDLVDGKDLRLCEDGRPVTYIHLLFDRHEIVTADGVQSESFLPGPETLTSFDADLLDELQRLLRQDRRAAMRAARPCLRRQEAILLKALRARTAA